MRTVWIVILSLISLTLGAIGGLAWKGATTSLAGLRIACDVVATSERSGLMTKAQTSDVIDRLIKQIEKDESRDPEIGAFAKELKAGCPTLAKIGAKG